ncbi:MAG: Flagellar hook-associated protein 2 [Modestobacter sp.]|nr:Flagellar hook-associated protein 2 [Modestobacter sp.]
MSMSMSTGLISGMDTGTLVSQLMQVEAQPQTLLKTRLSSAQAGATAYRAINTRFDGLRTAAEALTQNSTWTSTKATSSAAAATATAGAGAVAGQLSFTVDSVATNHSVISQASWAAMDTAYGSSTLSVTVGATTTAVPITGQGGKPPTLADAVASINASAAGLTATAVQVSAGKYQLQVTAKDSGTAASFSLDTPGAFAVVTDGADARLTVGTGAGKYQVTSTTNDFVGLLGATTVSVNAVSTSPVTVKVTSDPDAVAAKVTSLVTAINGLLDAVTSYTASGSSTAVLKGDSTLRSLASQVLSTVSSAVGTTSPAVAGLQLTKDGHVTFDSTTFVAKLKSDPALVQRLFAGTVTTAGPDAVLGSADDVTAPSGTAARLQALAKAASDSTTGTLTLLATSSDTKATDFQARIDDWDIRLALRKDTLTRQFTAMETALGTLHNQASWLTSQIAQLPSWSSSKN